MGKKAVKKTKELSVAIAESSSAEPQITPRKRGRPRKIIMEKSEEKEEEQIPQDFGENDSKRVRNSEEGDNKQKKLEEIKEEIGGSSKSKKEEGKFEDTELSMQQQQQPRRSRRKSKPKKSS